MPQLLCLGGKGGELILANVGTNSDVKARPDPIICTVKKHVPWQIKPSQLHEDLENTPGLSHQKPADPACEMLSDTLAVPLSISSTTRTQGECTKSVQEGGKSSLHLIPAYNTVLQQPQTRQRDEPGPGATQGVQAGDKLLTVYVRGPSRRQSRALLQHGSGRGQRHRAALKSSSSPGDRQLSCNNRHVCAFSSHILGTVHLAQNTEMVVSAKTAPRVFSQ